MHVSDENDDEGLERRLAGIDVDSASADELLERLTKEERNTLFKLPRDPASELTRKLLASTDLDRELQTLWWDSLQVPVDDVDTAAIRCGHRTVTSRGGTLMAQTTESGVSSTTV